MIDFNDVPEVGGDELLARYVFSGRHLRGDGTVRPDAFMPPQDLEMSVTRHLSATDAEIWAIGYSVAKQRSKSLFGRADVNVSACHRNKLRVIKHELFENPNHAHIVDWP